MIPSVAFADGEPLAWGSARSDRRDDIAALRGPVAAPAGWSPELRTALGNAFANGQIHPLHLDETVLRRLSHAQLGQVIEALGANRVQALVRSIPSTSDYMSQRYYMQLSRIFAADPQNFLRAFGTRDFSDDFRRRLLERLQDPDNLQAIAQVATALGGEHRANALQALILNNPGRAGYAMNSGARGSDILAALGHARAQAVMVVAMAGDGRNGEMLNITRWALNGAFPGRTTTERLNALHEFLNRPQAAGLAADFFTRNPGQAAVVLGNLSNDQLRAYLRTLGTTRANAVLRAMVRAGDIPGVMSVMARNGGTSLPSPDQQRQISTWIRETLPEGDLAMGRHVRAQFERIARHYGSSDLNAQQQAEGSGMALGLVIAGMQARISADDISAARRDVIISGLADTGGNALSAIPVAGPFIAAGISAVRTVYSAATVPTPNQVAAHVLGAISSELRERPPRGWTQNELNTFRRVFSEALNNNGFGLGTSSLGPSADTHYASATEQANDLVGAVLALAGDGETDGSNVGRYGITNGATFDTVVGGPAQGAGMLRD